MAHRESRSQRAAASAAAAIAALDDGTQDEIEETARAVSRSPRGERTKERVLKRSKTDTSKSISELKDLAVEQNRSIAELTRAAQLAVEAAMTMANVFRAQMEAAPTLAGNVAGQVMGAAAQLTEAIRAADTRAQPAAEAAAAAERERPPSVNDMKPKDLPEAISKIIAREANIFEKTMKKYVKNEERISSVTEQIEFFDEDTSKSRYPSGVKAFKSVESMSELDDEWLKTTESDYELKININKGSSIRQAMRTLHWETARNLRIMDQEAMLNHRKTLYPSVKKDHFKQTCLKSINEYEEKFNQNQWGFDDPMKNEAWKEALTIKTEKAYTKMIDNIKKGSSPS